MTRSPDHPMSCLSYTLPADMPALAGQILKIVAGFSQFGFACWLLFRRPRTVSNVSFAIFFGANGIAYLIFNLGVPGQRTTASLPVAGRAMLNWIATITALVFAASLLQRASRPRLAALSGAAVAALVLIGDLLARVHLSLFQFGGIAIYPATAFILGILPVLFLSGSPANEAFAWLGAALAINSVDHLGAEIIQPSPTPASAVLAQIVGMALVLVLWIAATLASKARSRVPLLMVLLCTVLPFAAGTLVREIAGSYLAVQKTGFIGLGRLAATALLTYAMTRSHVFPIAE